MVFVAWRSRVLMLYLILLLIALSGVDAASDSVANGASGAAAEAELTALVWPFNTLRCYSSMTKPDMKLICPEARSSLVLKKYQILNKICVGKRNISVIFTINRCVSTRNVRLLVYQEYPTSVTLVAHLSGKDFAVIQTIVTPRLICPKVQNYSIHPLV